MKVLSLYSGIGVYDYAFQMAGYEIVAQIEIDPFCRRVLEKHWPGLPRGRDIRNASAKKIEELCGKIDVIVGGFPCTNISNAGKREGLEGKESSLWWEMFRLIKELRPRFVLIENVSPLRVKGADTIFDALESENYSSWPFVVGAVHADAPHERNRVWIVAYDNVYLERPINMERGRAMVATVKGCSQSYSDGSKMERFKLVRTLGRCKKYRLRKEVVNPEIDGLQSRQVATGQEGECLSHSSRPGKILEYHNSNKLRQQSGRSSRTSRQSPLVSFPAGQGVLQYSFEEPREVFVKSEVGITAARNASDMVRWCKASLKAIGNANPPHVPYLFACVFLEIEKMYI